MAVQALNNKKLIIKHDEQTIVNSVKKHDVETTNLYGERKTNNNLDVDNLANLLADKLHFDLPTKNNAIDIDIKREISIGKVSKNAVKSEIIEGKVNNKFEKLKELRRNGS